MQLMGLVFNNKVFFIFAINHLKFSPLFRTNLSKELMGFPDFPVPEENDSFIPQETVLQFLNNFADHFKLKQLIKVIFKSN